MSLASLMFIVKYHYTPGSGFVNHSHEYLQLFYVVSGNAVFVVDNCRHVVPQNEFVLVKPFQTHQMICSNEGDLQLLDLKFTLNESQHKDAILELPTKLKDEGEYLQNLLSSIRKECQVERMFYETVVDCYMELMCYFFLRRKSAMEPAHLQIPLIDEAGSSPIVKKIIAYLKEHYKEELVLEELSDAVGYHPNYCSARFKKETGYTISHYQNVLRVYFSLNGVRMTNQPFQAIAEQVGFKNQSHFSKVFKSVLGVTPTQARLTEQDDLYFDQTLRPGNPYRFENS